MEWKAKNIIVFVGDGLGVSTHTMSRIYKGQKKGRSGEEESLVWEDWDYSGLIKVTIRNAFLRGGVLIIPVFLPDLQHRLPSA